MRPRAERQVPVGAARGIEPARFLELCGVVIGGDVIHHQPVPLGDRLPTELGVFCGGAHEMLHRCRPADGLFDDARQQRTVGLHLRPLLRILRQCQHRPCRAGRCRIVPRSGDDDVISGHVAIGQLLSVDHGIGDHAGDIVGGIGAALLRDPGEIVLEAFDRTGNQLHDLLCGHVLHARAGKVGILPAEHLLCQHQHARLILLGDAEDLHDNMQGIGGGDELAEIHDCAAAGCIDQRIDRALRDTAYLAFDPGEIARHEPVLRQFSVFGMDRCVEHHQRIHQHVAARRRARERDGGIETEDDRTRIVEEGGVILAHAHHVFIARDQPEGFEQAILLRHDAGHGGLHAQPVERVEQRVPTGVAMRIDHRARDVRRQDGPGSRRRHASACALAAYSSRSSRL